MPKTPRANYPDDHALSIHAKNIPQRREDAEDCTAGGGVNRLIDKDLDKTPD